MVLMSREDTLDGSRWSERNTSPYFCSGSPSGSSTLVQVRIAFRGTIPVAQLNALEYHEHRELEQLRARYRMAKYSP